MMWQDACALFLTLLAFHGVWSCPGSKPNVVFIMSDDHGYADVGFRGSDIRTPNIDALAQDGVVLENHYVQPVCSVTRAALLSGRYGTRTQFWQGNILPSQQWGLRLNETTMAEMLQRNGYATYLVGKWHVGMYTYAHTPVARGFDYFYGMYLGSQDYYKHINRRNLDLRENTLTESGDVNDILRNEDDGLYNTELFSNKSVELLSEHGPDGSKAGKPFFLLLSYSAPHTPYQADADKIDQYSSHMIHSSLKRKTYSTMISVMDEGIGSVVDALDQHGLRKNTIVVFISDNGGAMANVASNYPLRGGKASFFEGGVRSIAVVNSPLFWLKGYTNKHLHHVTDWYPTFQYLAGDDPTQHDKTQFPVDGYNIWDSINRNVSSGRDEVLISLREEDFIHGANKRPKNPRIKSVTSIDGMVNDHFIIRWKQWKLHYGDILVMNYTLTFPLTKGAITAVSTSFFALNQTRLYNLDNDPREMNNVQEDNTDIVQMLLAKRQGYKNNLLWIPKWGKSNDGKSNGVWVPWLQEEV